MSFGDNNVTRGRHPYVYGRRPEPVRPEDPRVVMERAMWRMSMVKASMLFLFGLLCLRAGVLMLLPDERLRAKASAQFQRHVMIEAPRGDIVSSDGRLLATTVEMPSLHADPKTLSELDPELLGGLSTSQFIENLSAELAQRLQLDIDFLRTQLSRNHREDVTLLHQLDPSRVEEIRSLAPRGVLWSRAVRPRFYPGRELASQVLGLVNHTGRGREGVEAVLDNHLRGDTFSYVQQRDGRGRAISPAPGMRQIAEPGDTVELTLDYQIQFAAEEALDRLVEDHAPTAVSAVVVDVQTGEILAMANRPNSNLNDRMSRDPADMRNHAVADAYEPGSVMKPFIAALSIDDGMATADRLIDCEQGRWRVGRSRIGDHGNEYGLISLTDIIRYSSNIGSAKLALELGAERVVEGFTDFGFAQATGVELPAEVRGVLGDPASIRPIELATLGYGQGKITSTAIQLAAAYATLGNGGLRMQPYLVSQITNDSGQVQLRNEPQAVEQVVRPETASEVIAMMRTVVVDGTGTAAQVPGYTAAGKTGTAQKVVDGVYSDTDYVATFAGLVPANNPRVAIVVVADSPPGINHFGGFVSGPAFSHIAEMAMAVMGVPQDAPIPEATPENDEPPEPIEEPLVTSLLWASSDTYLVPDVGGLAMRDVLALVDGAGLELALSGSGYAESQSPPPGTSISVGELLEVRFQ